MKHLKISVAYMLFHSSHTKPFAKLNALVKGSRVTLYNIRIDEDQLRHDTRGGICFDFALRNFRKIITKKVHSLLNDPDGLKFPIRWDDDTCFECTFSE